jgi:hypothetical protein
MTSSGPIHAQSDVIIPASSASRARVLIVSPYLRHQQAGMNTSTHVHASAHVFKRANPNARTTLVRSLVTIVAKTSEMHVALQVDKSCCEKVILIPSMAASLMNVSASPVQCVAHLHVHLYTLYMYNF